ncbi:unnamed protein product [Ectocarpus sp. CCAP 1310/34]|nr:unnamed protein product [Ectocarpus sp. CCAP 1310/34]
MYPKHKPSLCTQHITEFIRCGAVGGTGGVGGGETDKGKLSPRSRALSSPLKLLPLPLAPLPLVPLGAKHHPPACAHASLRRSNGRSTPSTGPLVALLHRDRFPLSKECVDAPCQAAPSPPSPLLLLRPPLLRSFIPPLL